MTLIRAADLYRAMGRPDVDVVRRFGIRECLVGHLDAFILFRKRPGARKVRRLLHRQQQREGWRIVSKSGHVL